MKAVAHPPRFDRLIERSLELGDVAQRLDKDGTPLLVIGHDGPDHIITTSDFTRPAASMALLAATAALDAYLWTALSAIEQAKIEPLLDENEKRIWNEGQDRGVPDERESSSGSLSFAWIQISHRAATRPSPSDSELI